MRKLYLVVTLLAATTALAQEPTVLDKQEKQNRDDPPAVNPLANSADFLAYHPDLDNRRMGMDAYKRSSFDYALRYFHWAARYADKPSQAMLASMYWDGKGVTQDRPLGYAWMDLAAERGYPSLLAFRERYWQELSDDERKHAIELGQPLYDEYGDAAAKPRLGVMLRRGLNQVTGSHTGFVGTMQIQIPSFGRTPTVIDANQYYDPHFWNERAYWAWADKAWKAPHGRVNVGIPKALPDAQPPAPKAASHAPDDNQHDNDGK